MSQDNSLWFIQFLHPGGEHTLREGNIKGWNEKDHRRKYIKNRGTFVSKINGPKKEATLGFWGEWEPQSRVERVTQSLVEGPRFIHSPYLSLPASYDGLKNTDPFVFGEQFQYTLCQQYKNGRPTKLRNLSEGSVILFGSYLKNRFVLDTVFVVDHRDDHNISDFESKLRDKVSPVYMNATLMPMYEEMKEAGSCTSVANDVSFGLYYGATFDKPVKGMFSFFPTLAHDKHPNGFARPSIHIDDIISDNMTQGFKLNWIEEEGKIQKLWRKVADAVIDAGLELGVWTELPDQICPGTLK